MAFKKVKLITSAVLSMALAVTACVTAVQGESSPLAVKPVGEFFTDTQTVTGKFGDVNNIVLDRPSDSVFGVTGVFKETSYYEQLDAGSQKVYDAILDTYKDGMITEEVDLVKYLPETKFTVTGTVNAQNQFILDSESQEVINNATGGCIFPAFLAATTDHPEYSWISTGSYAYRLQAKVGINSDGTYSYEITTVPFSVSTENIYGTPAEMTSAVEKAKGVIGTKETAYEQLKAIHDYLCDTIDYNYTAVGSTLPNGYDTGYYQTAYSAFYRIDQDGAGDKNLTVCAGYAKSFKILCDQYNIPCVYVSGYGVNNDGNGEPHAWDYVKMDDGKWYGVDVTWDDQDKIYYNYFLAGADTPGFTDLTFGGSHKSSGVWSSDASYEFKYPTLASEKYDPAKVEETTEDTTTEPADTSATEETTPKPADTSATEETTPKPADTSVTEETTPKPADTSATEETTPKPADTSATEETTPKPADTSVTETTTPKPADTSETEATTPKPADTSATEETTPKPADTSVTETTPKPEDTTAASGEPDVTTVAEETPAPDTTTAEETTAPDTTASESTTAPEEANGGVNVNVGEGAPEAEIDMNKDQLMDAVLSDEEKEQLGDGDVSIDFNISNADKTASDEEKKAVEDYLAAMQDGSYELGLYVNLELFKTVNGDKTAVTDTNKPIRITISVPEDLVKDGRAFGLVRVHDGEAEFLKDLDTDPKTITIESDKFSTYAVVYSDEQASEPTQDGQQTDDPAQGADDENKNTGFGFENSLIITLIISAATVFGSAITLYFKSAKSKK